MLKKSYRRAKSLLWTINVIAFIAILSAAFALPAYATPPSASAPASSDQSDQQNANGTKQSTSFFSGLARRSTFLGDIGGLRSALSKYGISLNILETSELLGNVSGGSQRGADYDGLTQVVLQMNTQRAYHHRGGTFNVSGLQLHGTNLSAANLYTLQTASGIEADRATRLWELWYDQTYLDQQKLDIKIGQQSLDQEYMVSTNALLFVNTMFGWAMVPSADLPAGGPAYPLSEIGIRAAYRPNTASNLLAGIYGGSPSPNNFDDSQKANSNGVKFPVNNGILAIAEAQFIYPALGAMVYDPSQAPLPRVLKIGAWYDSEKFQDQRYDTSGLSLANPNSNGIPRNRTGDYSVYGTLDQMVWHSETDYEKSLNVFGRLMAAPQEDRNLVDYSANFGLVLTDPFLGRDDDDAGIGLGFAKVGGSASALDSDTSFYTGTYFPKQTSETFIEGTYKYEVTPWFQIQPDIQYVFNPGGGVVNPSDPNHRIGNELVLGTRINIQF